MAQQTVTLQPGESRVVSFEATPAIAKTFQVSVDGLAGSFVASEAPFDPWSYDTNGDGVIDTQEMLAAVNDYYAGKITKTQVDQVVALWEQAPPPPPELANLYGIVTFRETGAPLEGVKVSVDGITTYTNASGEYSISNQSPGSYTMTLEKEGYETLSDTVTIVEGNNKIDAEMTLVPALMARLYGYITDADTGAAIAGAPITVVEKTGFMEANVYETTSDINGFYSMDMAFENSPIVVDISVKAIRYEMLIMEEVSLAEGDNELNFQMIPKEIPVEPVPISVDYPEQVVSDAEFWAGQTLFLPYASGIRYSFSLGARGDDTYLRLGMQGTSYLAADIYDKLEELGFLPEQKGRPKKYIRFSESGEYTHYGVGADSYSEPAKANYTYWGVADVPFPAGVYPVRRRASVYHVAIGYKNGHPYTKTTKISDLWDTYVGDIKVLPQTENFWASPTSHYAPSGSWSGPENAYDWRVDTHATTEKLDMNEWSKPLELILDSPVLSDKALFNADFNPKLNDEIDLAVHRDGVWVDVYQGPFENHAWVEKAFTQGIVDRARIRLRHTTNPEAAHEWLYEFQIFTIEVT